MRTELEVYASRTPSASPSAAIKHATRAMHADLEATKLQAAELQTQLAARDAAVLELQAQVESMQASMQTQTEGLLEQQALEASNTELKDVRWLSACLQYLLCFAWQPCGPFSRCLYPFFRCCLYC